MLNAQNNNQEIYVLFIVSTFLAVAHTNEGEH